MKKISIIVSFLLLASTSFSQVFKYRAFQTQVGMDGEWENHNILVVVNIDKENIHIYGQSETDLSILYLKNKIEKSDGTANFFEAVDERGVRCEVMLKIYILNGTNDPNENVAALSILYKEGAISFRLKKD